MLTSKPSVLLPDDKNNDQWLPLGTIVYQRLPIEKILIVFTLFFCPHLKTRPAGADDIRYPAHSCHVTASAPHTARIAVVLT